MKKKELKNRIEKLELEVLRLSIEKAIWVTMPQNLTKERHDYYESLKNDLNCSDFTPSQVEEAERRIFAKIGKTEGPESESELKENTISLEIRKKYLTRNGKEMTCWEKTSTGRYECTNEGDTFYYEKDGTLPGVSISWDIVSEVKE